MCSVRSGVCSVVGTNLGGEREERVMAECIESAREGGRRTSSRAHWISSASMRYMCGMICTGMLMRRSEKMKPMWSEDVRPDGPSSDFSLE